MRYLIYLCWRILLSFYGVSVKKHKNGMLVYRSRGMIWVDRNDALQRNWDIIQSMTKPKISA